MITKKELRNIIRDEIIGKETEITNSTNKHNTGIKGTIINETKNTIQIQTNKGDKKIMKKGNTFKINYKEHNISIKGDLLIGTPEERIKTKIKI